MLPKLRTLPMTVWLLGAISLLNDSASEMVYPLLPLYLSSVLMAGPRALGFIEGFAEAVSSLLKLFSGVLFDRTQRAKPWVISGYGLAGVARTAIAFASAWPVVLGLRVLDRIGKGLRSSPRDALLANSVSADQRGLAFGLHRAMDNLGAVIGPLVAAALLAGGVPLRTIFIYAGIPAILVLLLSLAIRDIQRDLKAAPATPLRFSLSAFPAEFRRYLLVLALFTLGNSSNLFLLLRARELGMPEYQVPLAWALIAAVAALLLTPISSWSDRIGRKRLIIGGWLWYGVIYAVLGSTDISLLGLWLLLASYGLFLAATEGTEKALVADLVPKHLVGSAFGWYNLTWGLMMLPASLIFGWLWQDISSPVAFGFGTTCALLAALLLRFWVRIERSA